MDVSISGIRAANMRLAVSANNVANIRTPDFNASRAIQREQPTQRGVSTYTVKTDSPPDLGFEMVDQLVSRRYAQANGKVIQTSIEMSGELVNLFA